MAGLGRILDALLGPRCEYGCGHRVFPRDRAWHQAHYHRATKGNGVTDRAVLKWTINVDDQPHRIGAGEIVHVACQDPGDPGAVMVWTVEPRIRPGEVPARRRIVQVFGTGQPLPFFARHLGSATAAAGRLIWHVFELPGREASPTGTEVVTGVVR